MLKVLSLVGILLVCPIVARAQDREAIFSDRGMAIANQYDRPNLYTYAPHHDPKERPASAVAVSGHILLEAYRVSHDSRWLKGMRAAGDSLIEHADMRGNGTTGWGRYWPLDTAGSDGKGGDTGFSRNCTMKPNAAYDDDFYDNARIAHFLLDLYNVTKEEKYLTAARKMIDDTWSQGQTTRNGGFYYFKTSGDCDKGWLVKNINMLMAVPMAMLASATNEPKYKERLDAMLRAERAELSGVPNFGYYSVETMAREPRRVGYVKASQDDGRDRVIHCNPKTKSGDSCVEHLGLEARSLDIVGRMTGNATTEEVKLIFAEMLRWDPTHCGAEQSEAGTPRSVTSCAAYYCEVRRLDKRYEDLCLERTADPHHTSPEIALGLFWGRPNRF
jgi:hypothetical protein